MTKSSLAGSSAPGPAAGPFATAAGTAGAGPPVGPAAAAQGSPGPIQGWLRFFRSELRLVFGRPRNQALLAVAALFPVVIGVGLRLAIQPGNTGGPDGVAFIGQLAGNGIFLGFVALTLLLVLVMPLAVAVAAGDSI